MGNLKEMNWKRTWVNTRCTLSANKRHENITSSAVFALVFIVNLQCVNTVYFFISERISHRCLIMRIFPCGVRVKSFQNYPWPTTLGWYKNAPSTWFQKRATSCMGHLVKKSMWWGVLTLSDPLGWARPVPVGATARGRSGASWAPWSCPTATKWKFSIVYGIWATIPFL